MKIKVWDLPTRIFHWLLVSAFIAAYFTSETEWFLEYHALIGYVALGLVLFRILWGFIGNRYARFSDFIKGWGDVSSYISGIMRLDIPRFVGHNPAAGWMVVFMLLLTSFITLSGIIVYSGEEGRGAFAHLFPFETAMNARALHSFLAYTAVGIIVMHICMALFHHFILKENIIYAMFTGVKEDSVSWEEASPHIYSAKGLSMNGLIVLILITIGAGAGLIYLPAEMEKDFEETEMEATFVKGGDIDLKQNKKWTAECATSCHIGFHPTLMPASSWNKIMSGLNKHFGEDVSLNKDIREEILSYLLSTSAERSSSEASRKLIHSIGKDEIPLRITDIPYWKRKHSKISEEVFKRRLVVNKSNCIACHPGSERGSFEDKDIKIPKDIENNQPQI